MEIVGIGTEIVECPRIGRMVEHHGELFLRRVYTGREIQFCQSRKHAIEHFASLWAAKEAIFKALGAYGSRQIAWTDIEVCCFSPHHLVSPISRLRCSRRRGIGCARVEAHMLRGWRCIDEST